jgi:transketolase
MVNVKELEKIAREIRKDILRMLVKAGSGHVGGSLSCADIITALYFYKMRYDPKNPKWDGRDRFILSKGHGCPALYAALARAGFFPRKELWTLRKTGSILQGHPDMNKTPGVEISTGSLGQGLSVANGIAMAGKLDGKNYNVYVLLGDGEIQEGSIWEAAMSAGCRKLDNLTAVIDRNMLQIDGRTEEIKGLEPLAEKWRAFSWHVAEINGHNFEEILNALNARSDRPKMIIARTVKGKGVSFMENEADYHGVAPTEEEFERAMKELE